MIDVLIVRARIVRVLAIRDGGGITGRPPSPRGGSEVHLHSLEKSIV